MAAFEVPPEELLAQHCKPGADLEAVHRRMILLKIFEQVPDEGIRQRLSPWLKSDGAWSSVAFRVAARFPMDWLQRKTFYAEELEEFLSLLKAESAIT